MNARTRNKLQKKKYMHKNVYLQLDNDQVKMLILSFVLYYNTLKL